MKRCATRAELAEALAASRASGSEVGFVPTMGALHAGHTSLMDVARAEVGAAGVVVASIFVNPMQFGEGEDLDAYPRTLDADLAAAQEHGVDVVFLPDVDEVYPGGEPQVTVDPGPLAHELEGAARPGHFAGVLTVVAKLLGLVQPDVAIFGEKDYQQLVLLRRMAADLCLPTRIVGAPVVREADGLAMSSRNRYLDEEQRFNAAGLIRTLRAAEAEAAYGAGAVIEAARAELRAAPGVDLDYLELRDTDLAPLPESADSPVEPVHARLLIAARVGTTRLLDNLSITLGAN